MNMSLIDSRPLAQVLLNYDIRDGLSVISCPTLIIHEDTDTVPLEYAKEIHENHILVCYLEFPLTQLLREWISIFKKVTRTY